MDLPAGEFRDASTIITVCGDVASDFRSFHADDDVADGVPADVVGARAAAAAGGRKAAAPAHVLLAGQVQASFSSQTLAQWLQDQAIPVTVAETGQALDLGEGARLKVLDVSPRGATLLLEWQSFRVLLPGGENLDTCQRNVDRGVFRISGNSLFIGIYGLE